MSDFREILNRARRFGRRQKYGSQKVERDGYSFASKLEASVYSLLKLREEAGEFTQIRCQVSVYLSDARILFKPDFECITAGGGSVYVEAKGLETAVYRIKRRLWMAYGPGPLEVYKGSHQRPKLAEVLLPTLKAVEASEEEVE